MAAAIGNAARLAGKTLLWFLVTALIAVIVGIVLGLVINPGQGVTLDTSGAQAPERVGSWVDFLTGIIPTNVVTAFSELNVLQIVFLGVVLGGAALAIG